MGMLMRRHKTFTERPPGPKPITNEAEVFASQEVTAAEQKPPFTDVKETSPQPQEQKGRKQKGL
jgi:hypothetical protein